MLCQFPGKAKADGFCRGAKVFAHKGVSSAQPGGGQFGAKGGRGVLATGKKKYLWMRQNFGYRVADTAMGRYQLPVLPRASHSGG